MSILLFDEGTNDIFLRANLGLLLLASEVAVWIRFFFSLTGGLITTGWFLGGLRGTTTQYPNFLFKF